MRNKLKVLVLMLFSFCLFASPCLSVQAFGGAEVLVETAPSRTGSQTKVSNGTIKNDTFEIKAVCGLGGLYREGSTLSVSLKMKSLKEDFSGVVQLSAAEGSNETIYEKDLSLQKDAEKMVSVSVQSVNTQFLTLRLIDEKGKTVLEEKIQLNMVYSGNIIIGALSDDYPSLLYFDGQDIEVRKSYGSTQFVELSADVMPDTASGLDLLSALVISSYDTSKLNPKQIEAIKNWVAAGGTLILGAGPDYRQTLSGFDSELVSVSDVQAAEGVLKCSREEAEEEKTFTRQDGINSLKLEGGQALSGVLEGEPFIWNKVYKRGCVTVCGMSLGMEPVNSWSDKYLFGQNLLGSAISAAPGAKIPEELDTYVDTWSLRQALRGMFPVKIPNSSMLQIFFILFVAFIGPILYLILKKLDKREYLWIIVPAVSVAFTAAILILNIGIRITNPLASSVVISQYEADSQTSTTKQNLAILNPGTRQEKIQLQPEITTLNTIRDNEYYYFNNTKNNSQVIIRENTEGYELKIKRTQPFQTSYFSLNSPGEELAEGLEVQVSRTISKTEGSVTNHLDRDLYDVAVCMQNEIIIFRSLKAGETKSLDEGVRQSSYYYDYSVFSRIGDWEGSEEDQYLAEYAWNIFWEGYCQNLDGNDVYTYACLPGYSSDCIQNKKIEESSCAILIHHQNKGYEDYNNAEIINLYEYCEDTSNWDPDGQLYGNSGSAVFSLNGAISKVLLLKRADDADAQYGATKDVTIWAKNYKTGQYEQLFTDGLTMEFTDGCPYLSDAGKMEMEFKTSNPSDYCFSAGISVIGERDYASY